jgi:two-component system sensor histidine kinase FlrB
LCTLFGVEKQKPDLKQPALQDLQGAFEQFNRLSVNLSASVDQINRHADRIKPPAAEPEPTDDARLLDAIPGGVVVLDRQGNVAAANESARSLLGPSPHGKAWRDIVTHVFLPELDQGELKTAEGRQFSISTRPLGYAPGQVLLLSDVTQTRELQRAAQQNLHLVTMGKMMASLAHQIRTPLASTMLYLSQCVDLALDNETARAFCQKALDRSRHIEKLINDMLVFAHGGQFVTTRFSVMDLFTELNDQLSPQLEQHAALLQLHGQVRDVELQGNKDALLGALANLCMNALQACARDPRIEIRVATTRHGLLSISLRDNGCGMDRDTRAHIFDPFFSTKTDGTGLGLAVVKAVIESHGGRIAVFSRPGRGCRFRIFLPCRQAMKTQISKNN